MNRPLSLFLDTLRARLPLATIIGQRIALTRRGREYTGLCPFHNEKTPSFTVCDEKGFFYCFGCGAHGDVIKFIMQTDGLSFPDAVEMLSRVAGIHNQLNAIKNKKTPIPKNETILLDVMEMATRFYERQLQLPTGKIGLDYLRKRGLNDSIIASFRLGFAPSGNTCSTDLKHKGIDEGLLITGGLLLRSVNGLSPYDTFRGRVIFPITDSRGRVIAFGGRSLGTAQPKYLNSFATPLFRKGEVLYGLTQARRSAIQKGTVVVTEGYMDVLSLVGAGFSYVVGQLGTTLTEKQLTTLWRLVPEPILCFDGDAAGRLADTRAVMRVLSLLKPGLSVRFASMPEEKDPDTLIQKEGPLAMADLLSESTPLFEKVWQTLLHNRPLETPEQLAALEYAINTTSSKILDLKVRQYYQQLLHERRRAFVRKFTKRQQKFSSFHKEGGLFTAPLPQMQEVAERVFTAFLLTHPQVLMCHIEQVTELLSGNKVLTNLIEVATSVLADRPDSIDGASLIAIIKRDYQETALLSALQQDLELALQRPCSDPEVDYQRMLLALHDHALTREIERVQSILLREPSPKTWQKLQLLQQERQRLHA